MVNSKDAKLQKNGGLKASLPVSDWQEIYTAIAPDYPEIASVIVLELQDSLDGYEEPGPTVELPAWEWQQLLTGMVGVGSCEVIVAELTFQLITEE